MKRIFLFCAIFAGLFVSVGSAISADSRSGSFSIENQKVFSVSGDGSRSELKGVYVNIFSYEGKDDAAWFQLDEGIYCARLASGEVIGFLPAEEDDYCAELVFSPGLKYVAADTGTSAERLFIVYDFGSGRELAVLRGMGKCAWADGERLIYTRLDDEERDKPGEVINRTSVALHNIRTGRVAVVKGATETSDFELTEVRCGTVLLAEYYVESPKDWGDYENVRQRSVTVQIQ
jgi:hypothetical protein